MKWTYMYMQNFLSIEETSLDLNNQGLVLIEGKNQTNGSFKSNGSGKSSLIDGIVYALFDTTSKGLKADQVVNKNNGKNTIVILEGEKDGSTYRIERYRKHSKNKNRVKLFLDDKEITEKSAKDTNKKIESIIGIDYNTFINSIFFSQGTGAGRFSQATDKEKKQILENLVNLDIYADAQQVAKDRIKNKEEEIEENKKEQERLQWELTNIDSLEKQDIENYESTKQMIHQEKDNIERLNNEKDQYVNENQQYIQGKREELDDIHSRLNNFHNKDLTNIISQCQEHNNVIKQKETEKKNLEDKKEDIVKQYKDVQNKTHCPVCGNELDKDHREKEMNNLKEQLREHLVKISELTNEINEETEKYNELYDQYLEEKKEYDEINTQYQQLFKTAENIKDEVIQYENVVNAFDSNIDSSKTTLSKLQSIPEPVSRDEDRKVVNDKIKAHKEAELDLEDHKRKLEDVVKIYSNSGVKSHVLDLITPYLNERANKYLKTLSGSDIEITFSTQTRNKNGEMSDKFDVQVSNSTGGESYQANSEGEKKRIDLAISLAIQDLVLSKGDISSNIIFYDEVFDALDSIGTENVVDLLKDRLSVVGSIFVISHSESLKELFENVITVTKNKQGVSYVDKGNKEGEGFS